MLSTEKKEKLKEYLFSKYLVTLSETDIEAIEFICFEQPEKGFFDNNLAAQQIEQFFKDMPALSKKCICEEAALSYSSLTKAMKSKRISTKSFFLLYPTLKKYGFKH